MYWTNNKRFNLQQELKTYRPCQQAEHNELQPAGLHPTEADSIWHPDSEIFSENGCKLQHFASRGGVTFCFESRQVPSQVE
jgi:hypothetical protein